MRWILTLTVVLLAMAAVFYKTNWTGFPDQAAYAEEKTQLATTAPIGPIAPAMDVEAAYLAIPHQRTAFQAGTAEMPPGEAAYLAAFFRLTDLGVAERVYRQRRLRRGQWVDVASGSYSEILESLRSLETPAELLPVEGLVHEALQEQRDYLTQWAEKDDRAFFDPAAPLIRSSHGKLISAYKLLLSRYGSESAHNRQSFFDHLCALDFI